MIWVQKAAAYGAVGTMFLGGLLLVFGLSQWPQTAWTPLAIVLTAIFLICTGLMALVSLAQTLPQEKQR